MRGAQGATLRNSGTLILNSQVNYWGGALVDTSNGARPQLINTGAVRKTTGTATAHAAGTGVTEIASGADATVAIARPSMPSPGVSPSFHPCPGHNTATVTNGRRTGRHGAPA